MNKSKVFIKNKLTTTYQHNSYILFLFGSKQQLTYQYKHLCFIYHSFILHQLFLAKSNSYHGRGMMPACTFSNDRQAIFQAYSSSINSKDSKSIITSHQCDSKSIITSHQCDSKSNITSHQCDSKSIITSHQCDSNVAHQQINK